MRIRRVEIERFLGFKSVSIDLDPQLQLVAGPNNAGKSSLVRLVEAFFSDPSDEGLLHLHPLNDYYLHLGPRTLSSIMVWFSDLTSDEEMIFAPILRRDGQVWLKLRSSKAGSISYQASQSPSADDAKAFYHEVLSRFHFAKIPSVRVGGASDRGEPESLERLLDTLEAILVRTGSARSTNLQRDFQRSMAPVETLVKEVLDSSAAAIMSDLPFREKRVTFRLPEPKMALRAMLESAVIESHGSVQVPVADRGTGFQSALVLGILRYVASREAGVGNVFFAIEEPEAFLHPQTQRAMAQVLARIGADAQLLITTHSSVVVDSFEIRQIARLPLDPEGLEHVWVEPTLDGATAGRLTRYCNATNSELIFANAVIFVEGEGDLVVLEHLLGSICAFPGGHYAMGLTVIEVGGITTMRHLVRLAELLGVRSYVLSDMDGLHNRGGHRRLIDALAERDEAPSAATISTLHGLADAGCTTQRAALRRQKDLCAELDDYDAFIHCSDLEGLLIESFGIDHIFEVLGSKGEGLINATFEADLRKDPDSGYERMAAWMGSKGWDSKRKPTNKLKPHLGPVLIDEWYSKKARTPKALKPLEAWLQEIVKQASRAPV